MWLGRWGTFTFFISHWKCLVLSAWTTSTQITRPDSRPAHFYCLAKGKHFLEFLPKTFIRKTSNLTTMRWNKLNNYKFKQIDESSLNSRQEKFKSRHFSGQKWYLSRYLKYLMRYNYSRNILVTFVDQKIDKMTQEREDISWLMVWGVIFHHGRQGVLRRMYSYWLHYIGRQKTAHGYSSTNIFLFFFFLQPESPGLWV